MLERANKWLQRLDDREIIPSPDASKLEIPDVNGKKGRFADLLSTAMTNYQGISALHEEFTKRAAEGKLTADIPYHVAHHVPKDLLKSLKAIAPSKERKALTDRVVLETIANVRNRTTREFLYYIDKGIASGILVEGDALRRKIEECENEKKNIIEERNRLDEDFARVSTELISVRALYEDCERKRRIHPAGGSGTSGN